MKRVKELIHYKCDDTQSGRVNGEGIGVAVLDSGIVMHPDFDKRIIAFRDIVGKKRRIYDDNGHGTHVAGIIGGSGAMSERRELAGIAPRCRLVPIKVLDKNGDGNIQNVIEGIKTVINNREQYNIRIISISVGTFPHGANANETQLLKWVDRAWDLGLVVIAAAGNLGPENGTITIPGVSKKIITVGSTYERGFAEAAGKSKRNYSSRGPTQECICKPDLVAPGSNVISCNAHYIKKFQKNYAFKSGTSMATPVVSGAIALLMSKYPDVSNVEVKLRLRDTCDDLNQPRNQQGWGQLNIRRLLEPWA